MTTYLYPPVGSTEVHYAGVIYRPNVDGMIAVPDNVAPNMIDLAGCTRPKQVPIVTTAKRPTIGLTPGLAYFDSTLGKPIWRNAANTQWVDATGTTV